MAAEHHEVESKRQAHASHLKMVSTNQDHQPDEADGTCSEDGSHCPSGEERRAIDRQVIAARRQASELLGMYHAH